MILSHKDRGRFESNFWQGRPDECWLWLGSIKVRDGKPCYGNFRLGNEIVVAHRVAYFLEYGEFDESQDVLHKCDIPACVNPNHLFVGSKSDNMLDMHAKGRHPNSTDYVLVDEIIRLYESGRYNQRSSALAIKLSLDSLMGSDGLDNERGTSTYSHGSYQTLP